MFLLLASILSLSTAQPLNQGSATILMVPSEDNSTCFLTQASRMNVEALVVEGRGVGPADLAHLSPAIARACADKPTFWLTEPPKGGSVVRGGSGRSKRQASSCMQCACCSQAQAPAPSPLTVITITIPQPRPQCQRRSSCGCGCGAPVIVSSNTARVWGYAPPASLQAIPSAGYGQPRSAFVQGCPGNACQGRK